MHINFQPQTLDIVLADKKTWDMDLVRISIDGQPVPTSKLICEPLGDGTFVVRVPYADPTSLRVLQLPEFADFLSPDAKAVYAQKVDSTVVEIMRCNDCNMWWRPTTDEKMSMHFAPHVKGDPKDVIVGESKNHVDHQCTQHVKLVQFLGTEIEISHAATVVRPNVQSLIDLECEMAAKRLARIVNIGVQRGWLNYGVFSEAMVMPLATLSPTIRFIMLVYIASDFSQEELNQKFGGYFFLKEGELPRGADVWNHVTKDFVPAE